MEERGIQGEIIVVNDGSRDGTGGCIDMMVRRAHHDMSMHLRVITHSNNLGYGAAVRAGCDAAVSEWIAFMDSDGQFDPRDFDRLLTHVPTYDVVVGRRRKRADPFLRKLNAKLFGFLSWFVLGVWVRDMNCAMKIFKASIWKVARPMVTTGALFNAEFFSNLKRMRIPWFQVDVPHYPRRAGRQTGGNPKIILRMFRELWMLKRAPTSTVSESGGDFPVHSSRSGDPTEERTLAGVPHHR